jgi:tyrosinase
MLVSPVGLDRDFYRADIEVHGIDHAGVSYEGRIYFNNPDADRTTSRDPESGYAGCFHIFGHGGCLGDPGHCDVAPRRLHDPRPGHPLTPGRKTVIATDAVRRAIEGAKQITVTVVPVILSSTHHVGQPDDVVKFDSIRLVTYRQ